MSPALRRLGVLAASALLVAGPACSSDEGSSSTTTSATGGAAAFRPAPRRNPHLGPAGTATMHGDSESSDSTRLEGPGSGRVDVRSVGLGAVCASVLIGRDGFPVALCTRIADLRPVVHLLDPATGSSLASLEVTAGSLFGGVYGYLDEADRMVLVDGASDLLRIAHRRGASGWTLEVDQRIPLAGAIPSGDLVTSVSPDYRGRVWFATGGGTVGAVDTTTGSVRTVALRAGERVSNSISTAPSGMAVATDHAVYLVALEGGGRPVVRWRRAYDRGPARKPGQLSRGTGSTPTFFGPTDGADYVAIVDNAEPQAHLVVVRATGSRAGQVVCETEVLRRGGPGSENSPIGAGRTVVVASTYGYPYPRVPEDAGPSRPATAPFVGGMTRVDVRPDGSGCDVMWDSAVRSAAVPRLSTADGTVTTMTRRSPAGAATGSTATGNTATGIDDTFAYAVLDASSGKVLAEQDLGATGDPLQLAGTIGPGRVLWQGTVGSVLRIAPAAGAIP